MKTTARAHPNLALIKYWGKSDSQRNLPATSSIGLSINSFASTTTIHTSMPAAKVGSGSPLLGLLSGSGGSLSWTLSINDQPTQPERFEGFFQTLLNEVGFLNIKLNVHLDIKSNNTFPTAAGFASSSSGFAALAGAVNHSLELGMELPAVSALARCGSGSAGRSVFGGFVSLSRNASHANQLYAETYWPEIRCIIIQVSEEQKTISSRQAMEHCKATSPYYQSWIEDSKGLYEDALAAIAAKDIWKLGLRMRQSYLRMFSTMFSAENPILFWQPASLQIIKAVEAIRRRGLPVFETMDAGPQVKLVSTLEYCDELVQEIGNLNPRWQCVVSKIGGGIEVWNE